GEVFDVVLPNGFDAVVLEKVPVKMTEVRGDLEGFGSDNFAGGRIAPGIDVKFHLALEQAAEGFEQSAFEIGIKFFVKDFLEAGNAQDQAGLLVGVAGQVGDEFVIAAEIGDQHRLAERAEDVHA